MNDPEATRYLEARFVHHDRESLRRFIAQAPIYGVYAAGKHVGNIKLEIDRHHNRGNIGLLIGPEYWGRGYATHAINAITDLAFELGLRKVTAGAYAGNTGSIRAFEKAGFEREGVLKDHWLVDGEYQDGILLAKVNGS